MRNEPYLTIAAALLVAGRRDGATARRAAGSLVGAAAADELAAEREQKTQLETLTVENARGMIDLKASGREGRAICGRRRGEPLDAARRAAFRDGAAGAHATRERAVQSLLRVRELLNAEHGAGCAC
jgi:hypothetical protein